MKYKFNKYDKVLVRDTEEELWNMDLFVGYGSDDEYPYSCSKNNWKYCIPYEGNEHLLETNDEPTEPQSSNEQPTQSENVIFGVGLKPGYVLEFEDDGEKDFGIIFPTKHGLFISFVEGRVFSLETIVGCPKISKLTHIYYYVDGDSIISGEVLWAKPKNKVFSKSEIAEKLGLNENEFEIDCK